MNRIKMAAGMLVGAVLLQVGFMACSAHSPTGMVANLFDAGTGVLGAKDAQAQPMTCAQWDVKFVAGPTQMGLVMTLEAGWEPYTGLEVTTMVGLRRCHTSNP